MDKKVEVEISLKDNMSKQLNALSQSVKNVAKDMQNAVKSIQNSFNNITLNMNTKGIDNSINDIKKVMKENTKFIITSDLENKVKKQQIKTA